MYTLNTAAIDAAADVASRAYGLSTGLSIMASDVQSALNDIEARIDSVHMDLDMSPEFQDLLRRVEALEGLDLRISNLEERLNMLDFYTEAS